MKIILLCTLCAIILSGCANNPTLPPCQGGLGGLPDFVRLPFEGSGRELGVKDAVIIEVEGSCDGYATGSNWITNYEIELERQSLPYHFLGVGHGLDGLASTDSRPCLRYEVKPEWIDDFMLAVVEAAIDTGMWKVYFNRQTGIVDGEPEFECIELWASSSN